MDWDENTWLACGMSASPLSCYWAVPLSGIKWGQMLSCLRNETLPQSLTAFYVIFNFQKCLHFIKNNPQCFLPVSEVTLYFYYWHFISSWNQTGVFYIELGYCSLWLSSVLINHKHRDFTVFLLYARHYFSLLSPTFYAFNNVSFGKN
jgi:hypothetical protein